MTITITNTTTDAAATPSDTITTATSTEAFNMQDFLKTANIKMKNHLLTYKNARHENNKHNVTLVVILPYLATVPSPEFHDQTPRRTPQRW